MKIAFLSRYSGISDRGVETYVKELATRLSKDYEVDILTGKDSDSITRIIEGKYDIVIPTNGRMQAFKASITRLFSKHKLIISGQSGIGRDDIWNIFIARPDTYIALTDHELNWAKNWAFGTRLIKIPNGVDLKKFNPAGEKIKIDLPRPIILSVGALTWYKAHDLTIKALSKTDKGSLLIIGAGPKLQELQKMGEKLLGKKRFKIIQVKFENIPKYYRSADIFTLPSWNREAFGIVYVEAMASGLPVVAPDDSPRREIVGSAGIFVNVRDANVYKNGMQEALSKDWENIPRKQAEKFSWDKISESYRKVFRDLVNNKN